MTKLGQGVLSKSTLPYDPSRRVPRWQSSVHDLSSEKDLFLFFIKNWYKTSHNVNIRSNTKDSFIQHLKSFPPFLSFYISFYSEY